MTGDDTATTPPAHRARRPRLLGLSHRGRTRLLVIGLIAAVAIGIGGLSLIAIQGRADDQQQRADQATEEAELSATNARTIAEQIVAACDERGEVAEQLGDLCQQAEQVAEEPAEPVVIPPTDEQLRPLVQRYVEDWLTQNPPRDGRDGQTPTVDQLTDLIALELSRNPPPPGEDGEDGEDGRTPTPAEIRPIVAEEVAAYLLANPPPPGPQGERGEPGEDGADSTVPGPQGPAGADGKPGPACPDGAEPQTWTVDPAASVVTGLPPGDYLVCRAASGG